MKQPILGKTITELRREKGMTQEELVEACNISVRTLQRIESGKVTPRTYTIKAIFDALDCDFKQFSDNHAKLWQNNMVGHFKYINKKSMSFAAVVAFLGIMFIFVAGMHKKSSEPVGEKAFFGDWKLVALFDYGKMNEVPTSRVLRFTTDGFFTTYTMAGEVYNSGAFYVNTDTTFVTNHRYSNGDFAHTVNLYSYTITHDTLRFNGYYINRTGCSSYSTSYVNEVWVRTYDFSANHADIQENENTEG